MVIAVFFRLHYLFESSLLLYATLNFPLFRSRKVESSHNLNAQRFVRGASLQFFWGNKGSVNGCDHKFYTNRNDPH